MKVSLNKDFPMDGTVEAAWRCLQDIETVAGCMPGAEITGKIDQENFKGKVKVKLGPVVMAFNGDIAVEDIDENERKIHLIASGKDSKGTSSASMDLTAFIRPGESTNCDLVGNAEVTVNGKLANFGGRMMTQVADRILNQFADNFSKSISSCDVSDDVAESNAEPQGAEQQVQQQQQSRQSEPNEINGLKMAWNILIGFFKSLFVKT